MTGCWMLVAGRSMLIGYDSSWEKLTRLRRYHARAGVE